MNNLNLKNKPEMEKKEHKHFKITEKDASHVFSVKKNFLIFVLVMFIIFLSAFILILNNKKYYKNELIIAEEKSLKENQDTISLKEKYQSEVKKDVLEYLEKRKTFAPDNESFCQETIRTMVEKIMQLVVPTEFKKFHLELVVAMDKESGYCLLENGFTTPEANLIWDELKVQNPWLN